MKNFDDWEKSLSPSKDHGGGVDLGLAEKTPPAFLLNGSVPGACEKAPFFWKRPGRKKE